MVSAEEWLRLEDAAVAASKQAYCPYSKFPVGAALLAADGAVYTGCNVENASFGLTICAERNAVFHAVASGARSIKAIAIFTPTKVPTMPCGACRQVIFEFAPNAEFKCIGNDGAEVRSDLTKLLPLSFGPHDWVSK